MTTHFADDKTLAELARLERELAEAEKQINVLIAGLTEQTVRADEARQYAELNRAALRGLLTACEEAKWPLKAEHMTPMNEARKALAAEGGL